MLHVIFLELGNQNVLNYASRLPPYSSLQYVSTSLDQSLFVVVEDDGEIEDSARHAEVCIEVLRGEEGRNVRTDTNAGRRSYVG